MKYLENNAQYRFDSIANAIAKSNVPEHKMTLSSQIELKGGIYCLDQGSKS